MGNIGKPGPPEEARWKLWYQDHFDRECPRQIEAEGEGLLAGLIALWARHLFETVQEAGGEGFSRFDLWWEQGKTSIQIVGNWDGQVRLRGWIFSGGTTPRTEGYQGSAGKALLRNIAEVHRDLILRGETSEAILDLANTTEVRDDFENQLKSWLG